MSINFFHIITALFLIAAIDAHSTRNLIPLRVPVCQPKPCDCDKPGAIHCDGQNLSTLSIDPPSGIQSITALSMIGNKITRIGRNQLPGADRLNQLFLSNNQIEAIADAAFVGSTPNLGYIDLSNNRLSNLSESTFVGLSNLLILRLDHNRLENLSESGAVFAPLSKLLHLSVDWTPIEYVSNRTFVGLDSLIELSISHGKLSDFPIDTFKPLSRLETLSLRHNRFHVLPTEELKWLSQLKHVDFSGNPILTINSNTFRHNTYLRTISFVNMPELSYVEDCAFCNVYELRTLQIVNCTKFIDFDPEAFGRDNVYFRSIETIDLVNNSLTTLDEDMLPWRNVTGLIRLAGNPWKCDCDVLWMMNTGLKYDPAKPPTCASPLQLKDKSILSLRDYDPGFCILTRLNSRIRTARLFMIIAVLIVVFAILSISWYLLANRSRNGLKLRNFFYKPQLPKYAYRNLAMGDEVEQDMAVNASGNGGGGDDRDDDDAKKIVANKEKKRDLAVSLADDV